MPRINPILFVIVLFAAGFASAYFIRFPPAPGSASEGRALVGGPFALTDTSGKRVTDRDFRGKLMLVFFGYTHCPDVCPTELQNMTEVLQKLGPESNQVSVVFISVDPARDTPAALSDYVKNFHPAITGLTGTAEEVAAVAKAYKVYYKKAEGTPDAYAVDHSAFVYLMDREGNYLSHFLFNTAAGTIADAVRKHL
jgi:protein SCO1